MQLSNIKCTLFGMNFNQCNGKYRYLECIDQGLIIELLLNNKNKLIFLFLNNKKHSNI